MSEIRQLADVASERHSNSSDSDFVTFSALRKELDLRDSRNILPMIQRLVKEGIQLEKEKTLTSVNQNSGKRILSSQLRRLKLRFQNKLSVPILTGKPITGVNNTAVKIDLIDENTGLIVKLGPEASATVEIVVLQVNGDEGNEWTSEKFTHKIVKDGGGNRPLLSGNSYLNLNEGTGLLGKISFTHKSSWMRKCEFMLGARFVENFEGIAVIEAISDPFTLEDRRNKLYKKHQTPSLSDDVWRLKNISKGGPICKRLEKGKIVTVKDFLIQFFTNRQSLREILSMSDKIFNATVAHALSCELEEKRFYYIPGSQQQAGIVFNVDEQLVGVLSRCHLVRSDNLPETEKEDAQKSVPSAVPYSENPLSCSSTHSVFYDHTHPSTSSRNIISSYNFIGTSHRNVGYDHMHASTPSPNISLSNILTGTSGIKAVFDHTQPSTSSLSSDYIADHINSEYNEREPIFSPEVIISSSNDSSNNFAAIASGVGDSGPLNIADIEFSDVEFLPDLSRSSEQVPNYGSFDPDSMIQGLVDPEAMFDPASFIRDCDVDEQRRFPSKDSIKKCFKIMSIVLRFSLRKRNGDVENNPKRQRIQ